MNQQPIRTHHKTPPPWNLSLIGRNVLIDMWTPFERERARQLGSQFDQMSNVCRAKLVKWWVDSCNNFAINFYFWAQIPQKWEGKFEVHVVKFCGDNVMEKLWNCLSKFRSARRCQVTLLPAIISYAQFFLFYNYSKYQKRQQFYSLLFKKKLHCIFSWFWDQWVYIWRHDIRPQI